MAKATCSVEGCPRLHYGRGLCSMHWQRQWKSGTLTIQPRDKDPYAGTEHKTCRRCGEVKLRTEFTLNKARKDGLSLYCRVCHRAMTKEWVRANPNAASRSSRRTYLRKSYGITHDEYDAMLARQGGTCAICRGPQVRGRVFYCVDHDHVSGAIRGLLCANCNLLIGYAQDDVKRLGSAIGYLTKGET